MYFRNTYGIKICLQLSVVKINVKIFLFSAVKILPLISTAALCREHKRLFCPNSVTSYALLLQVQYDRKGGICQSRRGQGTCSLVALWHSSGLFAGFALHDAAASSWLRHSLPHGNCMGLPIWSSFPYKASNHAIAFYTIKFPIATCISFIAFLILDSQVVFLHAFKHALNHFILGRSEVTLIYLFFLPRSQ